MTPSERIQRNPGSINTALWEMPVEVVRWHESPRKRARHKSQGRRYFTEAGKTWLRQWIPVIGFRGVGILLGMGDHAVRSSVAIWRAKGEYWPPAPRSGYQLRRLDYSKQSEAIKRHQAEHGHPRGMLGKTHGPEFRAAASARMKNLAALGMHQFQRTVTDAERTRLSAAMSQRLRAGGNVYSRCKYGRREDLGGQFFRSSWEANYARYLDLMLKNKRIAAWDYEPETFWFEHIKRGVRSYTPDFRVTRLDGTQYYVEVKGWMDRKSKTKLARFRRFYKSETLEVVDAKAYRRLGSSLRGVIKNWEAA